MLLAKRSPLLAALPGTNVLEVGEHGIREVPWAELNLVRDWQNFLSAV